MTSGQKIKSILVGLFIIALSVLLFVWPKFGINLIGLIISLGLMTAGIKNLWFYFTMARHMVGGKNSLYTGVILLDLAFFAFSINISRFYIILYLLGAHVFAGAVDIMLSLDAKGMGSSSWKFNFVSGIGNIMIALAAIVYGFVLKNETAVVYIYALGLLYTGVLRIANALRKTEIVYIQ